MKSASVFRLSLYNAPTLNSRVGIGSLGYFLESSMHDSGESSHDPINLMNAIDSDVSESMESIEKSILGVSLVDSSNATVGTTIWI
jgi:hypothetical protein